MELENDQEIANLLQSMIEKFDVVEIDGKFYPRALDADHETDAYGEFETRDAAEAFIAKWVSQQLFEDALAAQGN